MSASGLMPVAARRGLFYGWFVVGTGFVMQMLTGVAMQGLSIYVVPLQREFGWSSASIGLGRSLQQLDALFGPATGSLVDRLGPRVMMLSGVLLYALAFVMLGRLDDLPSFYLASLLMAVANSCVGFMVVGASINHWFRRKRTTALGIAAVGFALSGALIIPGLVRVQDMVGWRGSAVVTAIGMLLLGVPAARLVRGAPERYGLRPDGDGAEPIDDDGASASTAVTGFTLGEAVRTRAFWLITFGGATLSIVVSSVVVYQFAFIESVATREIAASVLVLLNVCSIIGRTMGGYLGDRFEKHVVMGVDVALGIGALALLTVADSAPSFLLYGALFGLAWGVRAPVFISIQGEYFGRRNFGRIVGTSQGLALPLALLGPVSAGAIIDVSGYRTAFGLLIGVSVAGALAFLMATRPSRPASARRG